MAAEGAPLDLIQPLLNLLGPAGTAVVVGFLARSWWKAREDEMQALKEAVKDWSDAARELKGLIKDVARLEGTDANQQAQITKLVETNATLSASLTALWAVCERVYPDHAKNRLSDRERDR